jgi:peptide chain release factor 1
MAEERKRTSLLEKLDALEKRYEELNELMVRPEVASDPALMQRYGREHATLSEIVQLYRELRKTQQQYHETEEMLNNGLDEELRVLAR